MSQSKFAALCISPLCGNSCSECNCALTPEQVTQYALRYAYLRQRDLETIENGGVFAGMTPINIVLNGDDLDAAIDAAMLPPAGLFDDLPSDSHFC